MPLYEVRRRTVLATSVVEAPDEMQARIKARDVWQQDAAIASLSADVVRVPALDPFDAYLDEVSDNTLETEADRESEQAREERWTP